MVFFLDIYVFLLVYLSVSFLSVFKCNSFEFNSFGDFKTLAILSAILLPIKSPVASPVFWIALFEGTLNGL